MKKNALLTFIFACIPGAGQMYYGYMKRGTSLLVYFCLFIMLGTIISPLVVGVAVVYMFSFFDTYDLIRYLVAGDPKPDEFLLPPDWQKQFGGAKAKMTPKMNKIIGWCLLLTGVYVMYDSVVWPIVRNILQQLGVYGGYNLYHQQRDPFRCGGGAADRLWRPPAGLWQTCPPQRYRRPAPVPGLNRQSKQI